MSVKSVLLVDDDEAFRTYVALMLRTEGYDVEAIESAEPLFARLQSAESLPSVILLDVLLPDMDGIRIMEKIKAMGLNVPVVVLSGVGHVRTVVEAMRLGACDFIMKPAEDSELQSAIETALDGFEERQALEPTASQTDATGMFVTANPEMRRLAQIVRRVAPADVPILIAGESGTGKEVMARYAHGHSGRQNRQFLKVNCAALPHELLESELFGYERGAFTGAVSDKPGKFELADGGTLFLDEIGEMSPLLQAKLLHVLQDGTFSKLGGRKTIRVDVRIVAATNINIEEAVANGKFREDLYFRLNVIRVDLPPLRERKEDIPGLCSYFIGKYREQYNARAHELPPDLLRRFVEYHWPGNIRELENYIKRFLVLPDHQLLLAEPNSDPAPAEDAPHDTADAPLSLLGVGAIAAERAEQELVRRVLEQTNGNRKLAARRMNICYKALLNKLKRWSGPQTRPDAAA
ncbi:MAG TPA: sigma-54 dependent transcriptional regulator [Terriglobia bacterium]|jgi:DNA-binding NtrC family response regulator